MVGKEFGGIVTPESIVVRDWKDYHLYSFKANTWIRVPTDNLRNLEDLDWITCAYLPSVNQMITLEDDLEALDLTTLTVRYFPVLEPNPIPGSTVVNGDKIYLVGNEEIRNSREVMTREFLSFDPAAMKFEELPTLPGYQYRLETIAGGHLYALGPLKGPKAATDVIRYDKEKNRWAFVCELPFRAGSVVSAGDNLLLLGLNRHKGFLVVMDPETGTFKQFRTNVPWTHGLAFVHENKLYYLAGMKEHPEIREVFFRNPRWLDRTMYVLDLDKLPLKADSGSQ